LAGNVGEAYYSTMNMQVRMSTKGRIVIPKAIRERLQWRAGADLQIVEHSDGVLMCPSRQKREGITVEEFRSRVPPHEGAALTLEEVDAAVAKSRAEQFRKE